MSERLRITGGTRRGRRLESPPSSTIRPASDLVRQAVFNMLAGAVEDCVFYDVFAGTGIVGLEALSRGARRAVFIERDRRQLALIRRNLGRAGFTAEAIVRGSDAFLWARHFLRDETTSNIVFLGPPYPDFKTDLDRMLGLVSAIQGQLRDDDLFVVQFPKFIDPEKLPEPENWVRLRHYGKTRIGIWRRDGGAASASENAAAPFEQDRIDGDIVTASDWHFDRSADDDCGD